MNMTEREVYDAIRNGAAKAFFADAWATECELFGKSHIMSGKDIMSLIADYEIDPAALRAADRLCLDIGQFYVTTYGGLRELYAEKSGGLSLEEWGHYAAMQAMGHGVGLWEYVDDVFVPYIESVSLDRVYFEDSDEIKD